MSWKSQKIYVILLNYNGWKDTIECLESVIKSDYPNYQIVVVDNDSPNNSVDNIVAWAEGRLIAQVDNPELANLSTPCCVKPLDFVLYDRAQALAGGDTNLELSKESPLVLIQTGENRGFSAGNNVGIEYALAKGDASYIWLLNNDTVIQSDTLSCLYEKAELYGSDNARVGISGAKLMYYDRPDLIQGVGGGYNKWFAETKSIGIFEADSGQYDNESVVKSIEFPVGASMFVSIDFIRDVGLMCEDYFLYYEELDWVLRGKKKGWKVGYCWNAKVFHKDGGSIGSSGNPHTRGVLSDYYGLRNRLLFTKKFYPGQLWCVWLGYIVVIFNRIRRRQWDRLGLVFRAMKGDFYH